MSTITTILTTYKRPHLLSRAINSVRAQTWKDLIVAVRDNCSEDETEAIVYDILLVDPRIFYSKNIKNIGGFENIRQGIKSVETEYFSILADDDYLEPDFYSEALKLFNQYPDAGFVAFRTDVVNLNGEFLNTDLKNHKSSDSITHVYYNSEDGIDAYLKGDLPYTWTSYVFRRDIAISIDFGEFSEVGYGADILFIWRAATRFPFVVTNRKGANFTAHNESASSTIVNTFDERFLYWWRNRLLIIKNDPNVSDAIKKKISDYYFTHSTKSFSHTIFYIKAALRLMFTRIKNDQYHELKFDFIAMRSFLPISVLIVIKFTSIAVVQLSADNVIRFLLRLKRRLKKH